VIECRWIEPRAAGPDGDLYRAACELRESVLLRAVGMTFDEYVARYGDENASRHLVALAPGETAIVAGVSLLRPGYPDANTGKVMQVAVAEALRGSGIGRALMSAAAERARTFGLTRIMCHAQQTAVPFYERVGWRAEGEPFHEAGIAHQRMVRSLMPS